MFQYNEYIKKIQKLNLINIIKSITYQSDKNNSVLNKTFIHNVHFNRTLLELINILFVFYFYKKKKLLYSIVKYLAKLTS